MCTGSQTRTEVSLTGLAEMDGVAQLRHVVDELAAVAATDK